MTITTTTATTVAPINYSYNVLQLHKYRANQMPRKFKTGDKVTYKLSSKPPFFYATNKELKTGIILYYDPNLGQYRVRFGDFLEVWAEGRVLEYASRSFVKTPLYIDGLDNWVE